MSMTNNYPANNQSSKSNPFTGYVYPYPTGGASSYRASSSQGGGGGGSSWGPDNRTYKTQQYEAARNRSVVGRDNGPIGRDNFDLRDPSTWSAPYQRFLYDQGRPIQSIAASLGQDGWDNGVTQFIDQVNPVAAGFRITNAASKGEFKDAALEAANLGLNLIPGGWSKVAKTLGFGGSFALPNAGGEDAPIPFTKEPLLPKTRDMTMTADQMERRAAAERNRTDAQGRSGMGGPRVVPDIGVEQRPPGGYPGAPVPAPLDLAPLDPGQLSSTGQSLVMLEQVYQDALNQYGLGEKQGRQAYVQDVQGARRQATGAAQDLATQLAGSGMADSPAAAFAAGQMTNAPRMARETAARKSLDQLLADITTGRTQARTQRDMEKLRINQMISDYRTKNTFENQRNAYGRLADN